ncbi:unnamed protein product, partial [Pleuronectes platessa]
AGDRSSAAVSTVSGASVSASASVPESLSRGGITGRVSPWRNHRDGSLPAAASCFSLRRLCPQQRSPTFRGFPLVRTTKRGRPESKRYHIWKWRRALIGSRQWMRASTS